MPTLSLATLYATFRSGFFRRFTDGLQLTRLLVKRRRDKSSKRFAMRIRPCSFVSHGNFPNRPNAIARIANKIVGRFCACR